MKLKNLVTPGKNKMYYLRHLSVYVNIQFFICLKPENIDRCCKDINFVYALNIVIGIVATASTIAYATSMPFPFTGIYEQQLYIGLCNRTFLFFIDYHLSKLYLKLKCCILLTLLFYNSHQCRIHLQGFVNNLNIIN